MITATELTSAHVAGHYDELDEYYRKLWCEHLHHGLWLSGTENIQLAVEQLIDTVAKPLQLESGHSICDIGCGYGGTARYLAAQKKVNVVGLTISSAQYHYASQQVTDGHNPRFLLQNWETNQLEKESLDAAISIECVAHIVNKPIFFSQIFRVLKPGRRASLTAWLTCENPGTRQDRYLLHPICQEGRLPSMGSASEYRHLIEAAGFRVVHFADLSKSVRKTWRICAGRIVLEFCRSREARSFLKKANHAVFALTVMRILFAYYCGAMRYGHFVIEKPAR